MAGGGLIGRLLVKLGLDNSEYQRGLEQSKGKTNSFTGTIGKSFMKMGGIITAAFSVKAIVGFLNESAKLAGVAQGVKVAFDRINNPRLLDDLRQATKGTVDDLKLMQTAVQAKNFKIPLENLGTYLKFAAQRAKETGESVDYLVNSIVMGIGRKSPLILDNLGIGAVEVREEFKKTGDMAKAVANIIDREMDDSGDSVVTLADRAQQTEAAWKNMMVEIGQVTNQRNIIGWFYDLKTAIAELLPIMLQYNVGIRGAQDVKEFKTNVIDEISQSAVDAEDKLLRLEEALELKRKTLATQRVSRNTLTGDETLSITIGGEDPETSMILRGDEALKEIKRQQRELDLLEKEHAATRLAIDKEAAVSKLQLEKKTLSELLALRDTYRGKELNKIQKAELLAVNNEVKVRRGVIDSVQEEADTKSKTFAESKKELDENIATLEKQRAAYGDTLIFLQEELKLKKQLLEYASDDTERQKLREEIQGLERKNELLKNSYSVGSEADLTNQLKAAEEEMKRLGTTTLEDRARFKELSDTIDELNRKIAALPQNYKINVEFTGLDESLAESEDYASKIMAPWNELQQGYEDYVAQFNDTLNNGIVGTIGGLGEAIGSALAGDDIGGALKTSILLPMAEMAGQIGKQMIAFGAAGEALKKLIKNPWLATAAGIALVALSKAAKSSIQKSIDGGGGGGGQPSNTFTGGGGGYSNSGPLPDSAFRDQSQVQVSGSFRLDGRDLVASIDKTEQYNKR